MFLHAVEVVVAKHHQGAAQGHVPIAGARGHAGDQAEEIIEQDEETEGTHQRQVALGVVADIVRQHLAQKGDGVFHDLLQGAGDDRQFPPYQPNDEQGHQSSQDCGEQVVVTFQDGQGLAMGKVGICVPCQVQQPREE